MVSSDLVGTNSKQDPPDRVYGCALLLFLSNEPFSQGVWLRHVVTPWGVNQGVSVAVKNYTPLLRI